MDDAEYRKTLDGIRAELEDILNSESVLEARLRVIRRRTDALAKAAQGLSALVGEDTEKESIGITDAIREILREGLTHIWKPTSVRNYLRRKEFPLEKYQNPLAVVHTTLRRLEGQGEVEAIRKSGKTFYKWIKSDEITDDDIPF